MADIAKKTVRNTAFVAVLCCVVFVGAFVAVSAGVAKAEAAEGDTAPKIDLKETLKDLVQFSEDDESASTEKTETVTVKADATGKANTTEVSVWLRNGDAADVLADETELTDIEADDEDQTYAGSLPSITWQAAGEDIYYTGKTEKACPVEVAVTYWLDGQEVAPDALAGKSGHVRIRYDYTNTASFSAHIGDAETTLYTPFLCLTALLLDNEVFRNVHAENARVENDGEAIIVVGTAAPGLRESLQLDEDFDVPQFFEVEADVEEFELATTATVVVPGLLDAINPDALASLDDDLGDIDEVKDAFGELIDGQSSLTNGLWQLQSGARQLQNGAAELEGQTSSLPTQTQQLADGATQLNSGVQQVISLIEAYEAQGAGSEALTQVKGALQEQLLPGSSQLKDSLAQFASVAPALHSGIAAMESGASQLASGIGSAASGSELIEDGLRTFNDEVIVALTDAADGDLGDLVERLRALKAHNYDTFSGKLPSTPSSVRFVIQVAPIEQ